MNGMEGGDRGEKKQNRAAVIDSPDREIYICSFTLEALPTLPRR